MKEDTLSVDTGVTGWQNWANPEVGEITVKADGTEVTVGVSVKAASGGWGAWDDFYLYRTGDYAGDDSSDDVIDDDDDNKDDNPDIDNPGDNSGDNPGDNNNDNKDDNPTDNKDDNKPADVNSTLWINETKFSLYAIAHVEEPVAGKTTGEPAKASQVKTVPVYRLFNTKTGEYFYTMLKDERDTILANGATKGWTDEGSAWQASAKTTDKPVYRLFDINGKGGHVYTTDVTLKSELMTKGWIDEGIAWYAPSVSGRVIYKITNKTTGKILYTTSKAEKDTLDAAGFTCEEAEFRAY